MKLHWSILSLLFASSAGAQTASDAIRYALLNPAGTGRLVGVGGAFGALGAEFTATSLNPAGLAMYRTGELVFSPALRFANTEAAHPSSGFPFQEDRSAFRFDNIGIVFHTPTRRSRWKTFNVGIGLNQMANFHRDIYYSGYVEGTILNNWFAEAEPLLQADPSGGSLDPFTGGLAFETNAFYFQNNRPYYDFYGNENAGILQTHTISQSGQINELAFSFAGNYDEKLFVGATLGVPISRYAFDGDYREIDADGNVTFFDNLNFSEFLETNGLGFNTKFGVIYRHTQALRIGMYFHTPTWWRLTDNFDNSFSYQYTDGSGTNQISALSPDGSFEYRLTTPWRAGVSSAFLFQKNGFLSADVEWVDYSTARYNFTPGTADIGLKEQERAINSDIRRQYKGTANIRLGGEWALSAFRLRAGVNLIGRPEAAEPGFNVGFSGGVGVKARGFFLDLGVRTRSQPGVVVPYVDAPAIRTQNRTTEALLSVGFKL